MKWEINPQEYRYILGDFIRSGIHIEYEKVFIQGKPSTIKDAYGKEVLVYPESKTIYYPYITGRQYQVYKEYHFVTSENESWEYCIMSEVEAGDFEDYDIECFRNWEFFCESFNIDMEDKSKFQHAMNYCYAFIFDYKVRFLDFPSKSMDIIDRDLYDEQELLDDLKSMGVYKNGDETPYIKGDSISGKDEDIQKNHIFEIYENYTKQNPFYPIYMSLEWFYFVRGQRIGIDTILKSISYLNVIYQDDLLTNYILDSFPYMSEQEIIDIFQNVRDNYAAKNKTKRNEWYVHTASLMNDILENNSVKHIEQKIKKVRIFCNNQGYLLSEPSNHNIPYLSNVTIKYKNKVERIYHILLENGYIGEETVLSDFKYYLTGELESGIKGKIYWTKSQIEFVDFILCITNNNDTEWSSLINIFINKEGNPFNYNSLKSSKTQSKGRYIDMFENLFK